MFLLGPHCAALLRRRSRAFDIGIERLAVRVQRQPLGRVEGQPVNEAGGGRRAEASVALGLTNAADCWVSDVAVANAAVAVAVHASERLTLRKLLVEDADPPGSRNCSTGGCCGSGEWGVRVGGERCPPVPRGLRYWLCCSKPDRACMQRRKSKPCVLTPPPCPLSPSLATLLVWWLRRAATHQPTADRNPLPPAHPTKQAAAPTSLSVTLRSARAHCIPSVWPTPLSSALLSAALWRKAAPRCLDLEQPSCFSRMCTSRSRAAA